MFIPTTQLLILFIKTRFSLLEILRTQPMSFLLILFNEILFEKPSTAKPTRQPEILLQLILLKPPETDIPEIVSEDLL
jgi:hypothetical protein